MGRYEEARQELRLFLLNQPHNQAAPNTWSETAANDLLAHLFHILCGRSDPRFVSLLFPNGAPRAVDGSIKLKEAQGAVTGSEYTEAARGRPCGHIFEQSEATYYCKTCTADDTCVLCTRCFHASNHDGHQVTVSLSGGSGGCCDCGDPEAWKREVHCSIHSSNGNGDPAEGRTDTEVSDLPEDFRENVEGTISAALDYVIDVFSCSSEQMKVPNRDDAPQIIRRDELLSRLNPSYGTTGHPEADEEYVLVLWNDEKHTVDEVQEQVARAARRPRSYGLRVAKEVDSVGRCIVSRSTDVAELVRQSRILSQIKLTTTIRSSRDTFREQMCAVIIDWLNDIAGCSAGNDHRFLLDTVCKQLLQPWNIGSPAFNLIIAEGGHEDYQILDQRLENRKRVVARHWLQARMRQWQRQNQNQNTNQGQQEAPAQTVDADDPGGEDFEDDDDEGDGTALGFEGVADDEDLMEIDEDMIAAIGNATRNDAGIVTVAPFGTAVNDVPTDSGPDDRPMIEKRSDPNALFRDVPKLRGSASKAWTIVAPPHWSAQLSKSRPRTGQPIEEDLAQRVRVDYLVFYDMRMWKTLRHSLRHLYISTLVTVPRYKRLLSLRFAELYTHLSQLYLLADRESDHSIIFMSLQMLTTPTIAKEVVLESNFFTRLLAILYTFLTTRQVGEPQDVDVTASIAFDSGALTNRRFYHLFHDLKYLLEVPAVKTYIRTTSECLSQFIDFAKLFQGICPNVRAVSEHVEYESEAWMMASYLTRDVSRLSRQFSDCFAWKRNTDPNDITRAIRQVAKATVINSVGAEAWRFRNAELGAPNSTQPALRLQRHAYPGVPSADSCLEGIVVCEVEKTPISLWHALHYIMSWLIDAGKSMSSKQLASLLKFDHNQLQDKRSMQQLQIPLHDSDDYLLAMFDMPLRVCAFLAQVRAGMWVRNGMAIRHQVEYYRSVFQRDLSHQRDIFLLQTAFVVCQPSRFLASVIDRFTLTGWMCADYHVKEGFDDHQFIDVVEEFLHLLIVVLSDRTLLLSQEEEPRVHVAVARREIVHNLCFKPLTHSELSTKLSDKVTEMAEYEQVLSSVADYREPEGLSDAGLLRLKDQCFLEVDPYYAYYNKSQREEAETVLRNRLANIQGTTFLETFLQPRLRPIASGVFCDIAAFSQTKLFAQMVRCLVRYVEIFKSVTPPIQSTRTETLLQVLLHLILIAIQEDRHVAVATTSEHDSFLREACRQSNPYGGNLHGSDASVLQLLFGLHASGTYSASQPRLRFVLSKIRDASPTMFDKACAEDTSGLMRLDLLTKPAGHQANDASAKRRAALARQAKVMAAFKQQQNEFLENQSIIDTRGDDIMSDSDDDDYASAAEAPSKTWDVPGGTCILCQDETGDNRLHGTLGYVGHSHIFRQTDLEDPIGIHEVVSTPLRLDQGIDLIRDQVTAGLTVAVNGEGAVQASTSLRKGFSPSHVRLGTAFSGCGHVMHWSCFSDYCTAMRRRHQTQHARTQPEDKDKEEFICPLCKALGNVFMPVTCKGQKAIDPLNNLPILFPEWIEISMLPKQPPSDVPFYQSLRTEESLRRSRPEFTSQSHNVQDGSEILNATTTNGPIAMRESIQAHGRIIHTLEKNGLTQILPSPFQQRKVPLQVASFEALVESFAWSLSAVEIAQRGSQSANIWLDTIAPQTISQMRALHDVIVTQGSLITSDEDMPTALRLIASTHIESMYTDRDEINRFDVRSLFSQDVFVYLAQLSFYTGAVSMADFHQHMRLALFAEIVKVIMSAVVYPRGLERLTADLEVPLPMANDALQSDSGSFSVLVQDMLTIYSRVHDHLNGKLDDADLPNLDLDQDPNVRVRFDLLVRSLLPHYILPFARKCLLLMHIRFGVDYSRVVPWAGRNELETICELLMLPSLSDYINVHYSASRRLQGLVQRWVSHWTHDYARTASSVQSIQSPQRRNQLLKTAHEARRLQIPHPTLYELVKLPRTHDSLDAIVLDRHCPTTGGPLQDANICLLCGDFFCGQAACCTRSREGGCTRHMASCGGNTGMFLNIRKCAILFMHNKKGSWFVAPYLDRHGESDMGLKRHGQLFLNQRRYDRLFRDVWLGFNGGIQSAVARKLESELNTGGWETL